MLLPTRMAVLNYIYLYGESNVEQVMTGLKSDYGHEKQFNPKMYLEHLMALEANGLLTLSKYELNDQNELLLSYIITDDGKAAVDTYIPSSYKHKH